jgi:CheY-like chemotaxis protein
MNQEQQKIRILVADDDEMVLDCYRDAFLATENESTSVKLRSLSAELFDEGIQESESPNFKVVSCTQGEEAVDLAAQAARDGKPFDVVILDIRMPPGIDGVEAGSQIRNMDPDVEIIFVTGYSDIPRDDLERRVPPPAKMHYFNKPLSFLDLAETVVGLAQAS